MKNKFLAYIRRKIHKYDLYLHIRDCHAVRKSSLEILFYKLVEGKWFPMIVCHGRHSRRERDSWTRAESRRTRTASADRSTARECRRKF